jgi:glycine/D-amino acid oxidase-like deaminating enzyme
MRVVVCGAGVIGTCTAYFLARLGAQVTVVERTGVACAASGKSGGFLALDWCDGSPLQLLARRSFCLHRELAETLVGDWGYRAMTTYGGGAAARGVVGSAGERAMPWLAPGVAVSGRLGSAQTTAQVHPARFTAAMLDAAKAHGAELKMARVAGLVRAGAAVTGVATGGGTIDADAVVIAMGPWSILAAGWLAFPAVFGLKGHSLVFDTGDSVPAEALFLEYREEAGAVLSPEVFPRPDGTTYVCAISSESPLPVDPARVEPDVRAMERLEHLCQRLSPALRPDKILARQACYRPVTQDGLPLIGRVAGTDGAYVATGHSVWGILNAPATGEALAELVMSGAARNVDLSPFDPGRLPALDPRLIDAHA